jgi:cobalamin biosynthesis protein CobD/CbiB
MKHVAKANKVRAASGVFIFLATGVFSVALVRPYVAGFAIYLYVALALFFALMLLNLFARQSMLRFCSRIERSLTKEPKDDPGGPARFVP